MNRMQSPVTSRQSQVVQSPVVQPPVTKRLLESSVIVRTAQWLTRESRLAAAVTAGVRMFRRLDDAFARASADKQSSIEPARLEAMRQGSRVVRMLEAVFSAPFDAWDHSRLRPFVDAQRRTVDAMAPWERVRLLGWMLAVGVVTRAALFVASGAELMTATGLVWGIVLAAALLMMTACRQIAAAWQVWKERRR